ncbi:MAG: hypothetical protein AAFW67_11965 [Cyanobacteria bacterium J06638_38]
MNQLTPKVIDQIAKAIANGDLTGAQTIGVDTTNDALKMTSLKATMVDLERDLTYIRLANMMPKPQILDNVTQNVHQALVHKSDGNQYTLGGGFHANTEIPTVVDGTETRDSFIARNQHESYSVERYAQMTDTYGGDALSRGSKYALRNLMQRKAGNVYWADSKLSALAYDGLYAQHKSGLGTIFTSLEDYFNEVVIDLRGAPLTPGVINDAAIRISEFGNVVPTHFFGTMNLANEFNKNEFDKQRNVVMPGLMNNPQAFQTGNVAHTLPVSTPAGNIQIHGESYAGRPKAKRQGQAGMIGSPAAPTAGTVTPVAGDAQSKYVAADAGSVFYGVTSISASGKESALTVLPDVATASTIAAGDSNDIVWTADNSGVQTAGFRLYRTELGAATGTGATFYWIADIGITEFASGLESGAANTFRDRGRVLPNLQDGVMMNLSEDTFYQFTFVDPTAVALPQTLELPYVLISSDTPCLVRPRGVIRIINAAATANATNNPADAFGNAGV